MAAAITQMVGRVGPDRTAAESYPSLASVLEHLAGRVAVDDLNDVLRAAGGASLRVLLSHDRRQ